MNVETAIVDPFDGRLEPPTVSPFEGVECPRPFFNPQWLPIVAGLISRLDDSRLWGFDVYSDAGSEAWTAFRENIQELYERIVGIGSADMIKNIYAENCMIFAETCDGDVIDVLDVTSCIIANAQPLLSPALPDGGGTIPPSPQANDDPQRFQDVVVSDCDTDAICGGAYRVIDYIEENFRQLWAEIEALTSVSQFLESVVPVTDLLRDAKIERYTEIFNALTAIGSAAVENAFSSENKDAAACSIYCAVMANAPNCRFGMAELDRAREAWNYDLLVWPMIKAMTTSFFSDGLGKIIALGGVFNRKSIAKRFSLGLSDANDDCFTLCDACPADPIVTDALSDSESPERTINPSRLTLYGATFDNLANEIVGTIRPDNPRFEGGLVIDLGEYYQVTSVAFTSRVGLVADQVQDLTGYVDGVEIGNSVSNFANRNQVFNVPSEITAVRKIEFRWTIFTNSGADPDDDTHRITRVAVTCRGQTPDAALPPL